jgi:hypothetical protein
VSGAFPDGTCAADIPDGGFERYRLVDEDAEFEDFMQRCTDGLACYVCRQEERPMIATSALGVELWRCPSCGQEAIR